MSTEWVAALRADADDGEGAGWRRWPSTASPYEVRPPAASGADRLAKYLTPEQVAMLLTSCDLATPVGRRDLAILLLLARLGLRASEVAALGLADIDWRRGEITVRGKGNRHERLPLPADVGEALVVYLGGFRPATAAVREVFVGTRAPHRALTRAR